VVFFDIAGTRYQKQVVTAKDRLKTRYFRWVKVTKPCAVLAAPN
jgi:hypothetical protein